MTPEQLHFVWSNFYRSLSHNVQVNYARKCKLRQQDGELVMLCETEAVRAFAESRWRSTLTRAFMSEIRIESEER